MKKHKLKWRIMLTQKNGGSASYTHKWCYVCCTRRSNMSRMLHCEQNSSLWSLLVSWCKAWWSNVWNAELEFPALMNEMVKRTWQEVPNQFWEDWTLQPHFFIILAFPDITVLCSLGLQIKLIQVQSTPQKTLHTSLQLDQISILQSVSFFLLCAF